ncbi:MAG: amidohydrolase [Myxococcota bacterium]
MLTLLALACFESAPPPPAPDLVVLADVNVSVKNGRILAITSQMPAGATDAITLRADRVTAGFVDAHAHPDGYGRLLTELDLVGAKTYAETLQRIAAAAEAGDGWLVGRGWDQNDWPDAPAGGWPTAADLDEVTRGRPTRLTRIDGHAVWVNQAALDARRLGLGASDPVGGSIVRDETGRPAGVLVDTAMDLVQAPEPTSEALRDFLERGLVRLVEQGLTGVHVMGVDDITLGVMTQMDADGALPLRLWVYVRPDTSAAAQLMNEGPWQVDRLRVQGVKIMGDGALGSRGALLSADYADRPGHTGLPVTGPMQMRSLVSRLTPMGAQVAIHAIGDRAVRHALDAIESARRTSPGTRVRHRVEHAQIVDPDDVPRFAALNVVASVQPTHATSDMPWAGARLGPERLAWAYRWRSLADAGAVLAFGSDAPVEDPNPALGLWAATRRTDLAGKPEGGWRPEERVSLDEAIAAFTSGAAWAVGEEGRLGTLDPGKVADLTLWDTSGPRWKPVATVVDGQVVWPR